MKTVYKMIAGALCLCLLAACTGGQNSGPPNGSAPPQDFTGLPEGMRPGSAPQGEPDAMGSPLPYRAMWISYLEWPLLDTTGAEAFTASVCTALDNCVSAGLNTVIVQVRPFSDAIYPSRIYPWSHVITGTQGQSPGFDPLAIFIEQAHARGLLLEAWINPYRVRLNGSTLDNALAAENPAVLHPDWVRETENGLFYDPSLPEVQEMVAQGVVEILRNYKVDGIQFDDYFYPTMDEDFDAERFAQYGAGQTLAEWRRANVNALVKKVYETIKAEDPAVVFGISPQGNNDNNYTQQYSDVGLWLSMPGYVDYIMPQVYWGFDYTTQNGSQRYAFGNIIDEWLAMPRDASVSLAFGLGAYRIGAGDGSVAESAEWQSGRNLADMVRLLAARGADGYALYRYEQMFCSREYAELAAAECAALAEANGKPGLSSGQ